MTSRDIRILADFCELCSQPECPICAFVRRAEHRTLQIYCAEGAGDEQRRADVRAARGLCGHHSHMLRDARDALAAAVTALDIMDNLLRDLTATNARSPWQRRPNRPARCPVCVDVERYDRSVCAGIAAWADDERLCTALAASHGVCAPHLRTLATRGSLPPAFLDAQTTAWSRLRAEVAEYIRKRDDNYRREADGGEADAWKRAWCLISGTRIHTHES
ncbi:MAG: hypothetical protein RLZZ297_1297 [Chloroflexota bacterium]